jgi:hypothetical protein
MQGIVAPGVDVIDTAHLVRLHILRRINGCVRLLFRLPPDESFVSLADRRDMPSIIPDSHDDKPGK